MESDKTTHYSDDTERVAQIEMLYQQQITVQIPVEDMPANPESAFHLVKNTDPEFVCDVLPTTWMDISRDNLRVVDVSDVTESVRSVDTGTDRSGGDE
jgi:hypothetical protein